MALREFMDERGVRWTVWSVSSDALHPATWSEDFVRQFASGWLCFESGDGETRRLIEYPEGWEALSDDALAVLCGRAVPRPAGRPGGGPAAQRAGRIVDVPDLDGDSDVALASAELSERRRADLAPPPEHPRRRRGDRAR